MRSLVLLGLVVLVGCGASRAAPIAVPSTETIVAAAPAEAAPMAAAVIGAPIDPTTIPSGIEVTFAGVPGLDGTIVLPHNGCSYGSHDWQNFGAGFVECPKCRASTRGLWYYRRVPFGANDSVLVACLIEGLEINRMQFGVGMSSSFKMAPSVIAEPNEGTYPFAGGTVTIAAIP